MTGTLQTKPATTGNRSGEERASYAMAIDDRRHQVRLGAPTAVVRPIERSRNMITQQEAAQRDYQMVETLLTSLAVGERESSLRLTARVASSALSRAQEDAAIEGQGVLAQADEALVLG